MELPLAHLTIARSFEFILKTGRLKPHPCKIFNANLLYFSYGGLFYRSSSLQTEQTSELPIGFVFSPKIFKTISRLFPFDSGAMAAKRFGCDWFDRLAPFDTRFAIDSDEVSKAARALVFHLFESNSRYVAGQPAQSSMNKQTPLPLLYEFLAADFSHLSVDHRQRTIEAIAKISISLNQHLLWIGLPQISTSSRLRELYRWTKPNIPQIFEYSYHQNFNPSRIAEVLEWAAHRDIVERFVNLEAE